MIIGHTTGAHWVTAETQARPSASGVTNQQGKGPVLDALAVVNLDATPDLEDTRRALRKLADTHHLNLRDTLTFRPAEPQWIQRVVETVHRFSIHAVLITDITHLDGGQRAIIGVADLMSPTTTLLYEPYQRGYTRPSAIRLPSAR